MRIQFIVFFVLCVNLLAAQTGITRFKTTSKSIDIDFMGATGLAVDDTGRVWISFANYWANRLTYRATSVGLASYGSDSIWTITDTIGLGTKYLQHLKFIDSALWMGSDNGLICKKGNTFTRFKNNAPHLPGDTVNQFLVNKRSLVLACQNGLHVYHKILQGDFWQSFDTTNSALPTNKIFAVAQDQPGSFWLGTDKGVIHFNSSTNQVLVYNHTNSEFWTDTILSIAAMPNGDVWAGTVRYSALNNEHKSLTGLFKFSSNGFKNLTSLIGVCQIVVLPKIDFNEISTEGNQVLIYGPDDGYQLYSQNNLLIYNPEWIWSTDALHTTHKSFNILNYHLPKYFLKSNQNIYSLSNSSGTSTGPFQMVAVDLKKVASDDSINQIRLFGNSNSSDTLRNEKFSNIDINHLNVPLSVKGDFFQINFQTMFLVSVLIKPHVNLLQDGVAFGWEGILLMNYM